MAELMVGKDVSGRSPLHYAALNNNLAEAVELAEAGADLNERDRQGFSPLHFAAQEGSVEVAGELLRRGAEVDTTNKFGNTPLWVAVFNSRGQGELITVLRGHGADPNRQNNSGISPLSLAKTIANYDVDQFFSDLNS